MSQSLLARFISGTISIGFGQICVLTLGLVGTMIVARRLPAEEFGAYVLLQVIATFLAQVSNLGLDEALANALAHTEIGVRRRRLVNTAICVRLCVVLVVGAMSLVLRRLIFALLGNLLAELLIVVPVLFLLQGLTDTLRFALQGFFLFQDMGKASLIASISHFLLIVTLVVFLENGLMGLVYSRLISMFLALVYISFAVPTQKRMEVDRRLLSQLLRFGLPLQVNSILTFVYQRVDTLIIGALLGPAGIAYYEIARKIPGSLEQVFGAFRSVFFPFMSRLYHLGDETKTAHLVNNSTRLVSFASFFATLLTLLFGSELIRLLFSEQYLASVPAFIVSMIALSVAFVSNLLGTSLVAIGDTSKPAMVNTVHAGVSLLANVISIPVLGITGAALASLAGNVVSNPLNAFLLRRRIGIGVSGYVKPALVFCLCLALFLVWKPATFFQKASLIPLYLLLCGFLSSITMGDAAAVATESRTAIVMILRNPRSGSTRV